MQNKEKGEVAFYSKYDESEITLRFDFNAFCVLENLFDGKPAPQILEDFVKGKLGFSGMRKLFLAGMMNNPDNGSAMELQLEATGERIQELGGVEGAGKYLTEAINAAFPKDKGKSAKKRKG